MQSKDDRPSAAPDGAVRLCTGVHGTDVSPFGQGGSREATRVRLGDAWRGRQAGTVIWWLYALLASRPTA